MNFAVLDNFKDRLRALSTASDAAHDAIKIMSWSMLFLVGIVLGLMNFKELWSQVLLCCVLLVVCIVLFVRLYRRPWEEDQ